MEYWRFEEHPFDDYILRGDALRLFVGRDHILHHLHNSLSNRLIGVHGTPGVGKSSFFRKFEQIILRSGLAVVYVHLTATTENALYREILATILRAHANKEIKTDRKLKLDSKKELQRVEYGIRIAHETEFGANAVLKAHRKEVTEKQIDPHTEESARGLIRDIIVNTQTAFVVIIDDLERMQLFLTNEAAYSRFVSGFAKTVDESFSDEKVAFVVSLDSQFVSRIRQESPEGNGAVSFSFAELIELEDFRPQELAKVVRIRLEEHGWPGYLSDFMTLGAFWTLATATGGHARRTLAILRSAMEYVEREKKPKKLDEECILEGLASRRWNVDKKNTAIVKFLSASGACSASDEGFQAAANLKRRQLLERLKELAPRLDLLVTQETSGTATKDLYSLPQIDFGD